MTKILYAVAAGLLLAACVMHLSHGDAGDKAMQLYAARQWLLGQRLYIDTFFDMNTPLLVWLYAIPSSIALHFPLLSDSLALMLLGLGVTACVIALSLRLMALHPCFTRPEPRRELTLLLAFMFIFYTNSANFFHREQIFLLLSFPYLLRVMPSLARRKLPPILSALIGAMAGVGFSMKPHCLLIFAGVQAVTLLRERSFFMLLSLENLLIYALILLYYGAIWYFTPDYYTVVLPMALETYGVINRKLDSLPQLLIEWFLFALPLADFRPRYQSPYRRDIYYLMQLCGWFLLYVLINNGWGYTYSLLNNLVLFMTGFLLFEYRFLKKEHEARAESSRPFLFGIRACWTSFAINILFPVYMGAQIHFFPCGSDMGCEAHEHLVAEVSRDGRLHSFGTLSVLADRWVRVARDPGAPWQSRFYQLWMLPKFFISDESFRRDHHAILDTVAADLAEDLNSRKPDIVFVEHTNRYFTIHKDVDLAAYLKSMPVFARAFSPYRLAYSISCNIQSNENCRYDVYRRE